MENTFTFRDFNKTKENYEQFDYSKIPNETFVITSEKRERVGDLEDGKLLEFEVTGNGVLVNKSLHFMYQKIVIDPGPSPTFPNLWMESDHDANHFESIEVFMNGQLLYKEDYPLLTYIIQEKNFENISYQRVSDNLFSYPKNFINYTGNFTTGFRRGRDRFFRLNLLFDDDIPLYKLSSFKIRIKLNIPSNNTYVFRKCNILYDVIHPSPIVLTDHTPFSVTLRHRYYYTQHGFTDDLFDPEDIVFDIKTCIKDVHKMYIYMQQDSQDKSRSIVYFNANLPLLTAKGVTLPIHSDSSLNFPCPVSSYKNELNTRFMPYYEQDFDSVENRQFFEMGNIKVSLRVSNVFLQVDLKENKHVLYILVLESLEKATITHNSVIISKHESNT